MIFSLISDVELLNIIEFSYKFIDNLKPEISNSKLDKTRELLVLVISIALFLLCLFFDKSDNISSENNIYDVKNDEVYLNNYYFNPNKTTLNVSYFSI